MTFPILSPQNSYTGHWFDPILDYNSTLWFPCQSSLIKEIEAIQNRFLRFDSVNCKIHKKQSPYAPLLNFLRLDTLEEEKSEHIIYINYPIIKLIALNYCP